MWMKVVNWLGKAGELLLLLSRFSRVRLCATPQMAAHQAPRPWDSPGKNTVAKSLQSCPTLCDPTDSSPPDSPVPVILQAGTLEWVAISFSNALK